MRKAAFHKQRVRGRDDTEGQTPTTFGVRLVGDPRTCQLTTPTRAEGLGAGSFILRFQSFQRIGFCKSLTEALPLVGWLKGFRRPTLRESAQSAGNLCG